MVFAKAFLVSALVLPACSQPVCTQIEALTKGPAAASAHWGVSVTKLDGTPVCQFNDAQLFRPASNNKIFTTATALALLGLDYRFATHVTGNLNLATGAVEGDLTLVGGGDPNLDSNDLPYLPRSQGPENPAPFAFHNLDDLVVQLVAKKVKAVTGNVLGDDTLFPHEPYPPSWNADDFQWGYGAPVSALTIADSKLPLTITPGGSPGEPATIGLDQHGLSFYTVIAQVSTGPARQPGGVAVERLPGSRALRVYGTIAADAVPDREQIAIDEPALFAAVAFRQALIRHGITVSGEARASHRPVEDGHSFEEQVQQATDAAQVSAASHGARRPAAQAGAILASHMSAPLLSDTLLTNKISQNLHAELQLRTLGREICVDVSDACGVGVVRAYLLRAGVSPQDFLLYDGSGLSDHDLVAPRAFTAFLRFAVTQPWFAEWKKTLPDSGAEGSLSSRFPALQGRVFAKTGTLGESRALSGYAITATGEMRIFSILVDTHLPGGGDRAIMDQIVVALAK